MDHKAVKKLLDNLRNDPQLRAEDDPSIVAEEQYPTSHHPIFGTCLEKTKLHECQKTRSGDIIRPALGVPW